MFDTRAFYYSTDELWFPEHDMQGVPWVQPENFEQWNPASPQLVAKWTTPMMIIHVRRTDAYNATAARVGANLCRCIRLSHSPSVGSALAACVLL